ncbi:winged helix DNA-binding domain-containing protein [Actinoplanes sp. NBC_00393]|uniref:winged helix DNA-binding domain-containing protein n=1 Tax=Actinoplanes sp. NBC_00393 TaxID=2975953 RepID=UPI002E1DA81D
MAVKVSRVDVIAYRLHAQHLDERLGKQGLLEAAGACGIQNSPPGSALAALHARVRNLSQDRFDAAVAEDKSLLQSWCMRGSPFYVPAAEAAVFTTGVLPPTEEAMRHFILGAGPSVDELGLELTDAVALAGAEIGDVLTGRRLAIDELGAELAERIAGKLSRKQRDIWQKEGPYAAGQPLGEGVVHFCIRILTLQKVVCFAPRDGNQAPFVLVDEWLSDPIPDTDPESARAELLRRYLRCYGPSTRADFAAWLGVRPGDAGPWWSLVEDEMTEVSFGRRTWILTEDLDGLRSATMPKGVRLLPPRDPYTQLRDRGTVVDKQHHRDVWKAVGAPGVVLVDGEIAGVWRSRKSGRKLTMTVSSFGTLPARSRKPLLAEAEQLATLRGASSVDVDFGSSAASAT